MMNSCIAANLAVACLLSFVAPSYQLQCYSCVVGLPSIDLSRLNGVITPTPTSLCADYNENLKVQCPQQQPACLNAYVTVEGLNSDAQTAAVKGCVDASGGVKNICDRLSSAKTIQATLGCETCVDDACNTGTSLTASLAIIMSHVFLYKILF